MEKKNWSRQETRPTAASTNRPQIPVPPALVAPGRAPPMPNRRATSLPSAGPTSRLPESLSGEPRSQRPSEELQAQSQGPRVRTAACKTWSSRGRASWRPARTRSWSACCSSASCSGGACTGWTRDTVPRSRCGWSGSSRSAARRGTRRATCALPGTPAAVLPSADTQRLSGRRHRRAGPGRPAPAASTRILIAYSLILG
jgi:hypothetical protein